MLIFKFGSQNAKQISMCAKSPLCSCHLLSEMLHVHIRSGVPESKSRWKEFHTNVSGWLKAGELRVFSDMLSNNKDWCISLFKRTQCGHMTTYSTELEKKYCS